MIPLITREISFGWNVNELVFGVDVFDLDLGVQTSSIKQPVKSNSVGPGNMSHCKTPSFNDHFDHCFIVFEHTQQSFLMRKSDVWGWTLSKTLVAPRDWWRTWFVSRRTTGLSVLSWFWVVFPRKKTIRSHKSRTRKKPVQSQSSVQRDDFGFCWTVWNWSLFLAHPTYWNKRMTSKNAQCSSRSGFRIFDVSCKIGVLKQSQPALFSGISHMAALFLFTCMMNVRDQSTQAFVTGFGPLCDWSCKIVHWP